MKANLNEIEINGDVYVKKGSAERPAMKEGYCIFRTYSAGVFAGNLGSRDGKEAVVLNARRLWKWSGAASLSQLAMEGVKNPGECKFAMPVDSITLTEVIEVIPCTEDAFKNIMGVPEWKI